MSVHSRCRPQTKAEGRSDAPDSSQSDPKCARERTDPDRDRGSLFPLFHFHPFLHPSLHLCPLMPCSPVTPGLGPFPRPVSANTEVCHMPNREMTERGQREMWREEMGRRERKNIPKTGKEIRGKKEWMRQVEDVKEK